MQRGKENYKTGEMLDYQELLVTSKTSPLRKLFGTRSQAYLLIDVVW